MDYAFYTRTSDIPSDFNAYSIFTYTWANSNNVLGIDFEIYSSFEDLKSGSNKWSFCNYNDADVGFPRDCGPNGAIGNTWFSFPGGEHNARGLTSGSSFELWDGSDCPSTATPITYTYTFEINKNVAVSHMEITKILIDGRSETGRTKPSCSTISPRVTCSGKTTSSRLVRKFWKSKLSRL